jgi:hypothetical protein
MGHLPSTERAAVRADDSPLTSPLPISGYALKASPATRWVTLRPSSASTRWSCTISVLLPLRRDDVGGMAAARVRAARHPARDIIRCTLRESS